MTRGSEYLVLVIAAACAKADGGAQQRKKEAARLEEEMRQGGTLGGVVTRRDSADVLVFRVPKDCDVLMSPLVLTAKLKDAVSLVEREHKLGFRRIECEEGTRVVGVDLPYEAPKESPAEKTERQRAARRRYAREQGIALGTDGSTGGADEDTLVLKLSVGCERADYERLIGRTPADRTDLTAIGFKRFECRSPKGNSTWNLDEP